MPASRVTATSASVPAMAAQIASKSHRSESLIRIGIFGKRQTSRTFSVPERTEPTSPRPLSAPRSKARNSAIEQSGMITAAGATHNVRPDRPLERRSSDAAGYRMQHASDLPAGGGPDDQESVSYVRL